MMMNKSARRWHQSLNQDPQYWGEHIKLDFAHALDRMLRQSGMSRSAMATALRSSPAYITKVLRGDTNLTIETMAKLAMAVGSRVHIHISEIDNRVRWIESFAARANAPTIDTASTVWATYKLEGKCHGNSIAA